MSALKMIVHTNVAPSTKQVTDITAWAAQAKKPVTRSRVSIPNARAKLDAMIASGDYSEATPIHVFVLHCMMHEHVYGVETHENAPEERKRSLFIIGGFLKSKFMGDMPALFDYVRWVWNREAYREKKRREEGRSGSRLIVKWIFNASMHTDFCVDRARQR